MMTSFNGSPVVSSHTEHDDVIDDHALLRVAVRTAYSLGSRQGQASGDSPAAVSDRM